MKNEPQQLRERLSIFYAICQERATNARTLGDFRSFTFSDTFLMNILTPPSDTIARAIREFAEDLIDRCARNDLKVRAFMTTGVESAEELPPALSPEPIRTTCDISICSACTLASSQRTLESIRT